MTLLRKSGGDITIVCGRGRSPITAIYNTDTHEHIYQRDKDRSKRYYLKDIKNTCDEYIIFVTVVV